MGTDAENTGKVQRGRPFGKGVSGNPHGRPKGSRNRTTAAAAALLEGEAQALTRKAIDMALGGDVVALRLCLERLLPPCRERTIRLELPAINSPSDGPAAVGAVLAAVSEGRVTIGEAEALLRLIEAGRMAIAGETLSPNAPVVHVSFKGCGIEDSKA